MTPPTPTGSSLPTGASEPGRPTWISMSFKTGHALLGGEFGRPRPARIARHEAETLLPVQPVDLVDHAVDVIAERGALLADPAMERQHFVNALAEFCQR